LAKKAITTRVHHLAKQLGVNSKDIVTKCADEGVDGIVNHQSAVSAGLSATIAEWFSEAADTKSSNSAVETSAKVDVKKARAKAKKTTRKKEITSKDATVKEGTKKKTTKKTPGKSDPVKPVGRKMATPVKAKMAGPRVIRVEEPEPEPRPKRRPPMQQSSPGGGGVRTPSGGSVDLPPSTSRPDSRRNKRRGASHEGERTNRNVPTQTRNDNNWRQQDLLERENRLRRSGGFFRQARRDNQKRTGKQAVQAKTLAQTGGKVSILEPVSIKELSATTGIKANEILKKLMLDGTMATVNDNVETEKAIEMMMEWGIELNVVEVKTEVDKIADSFTDRTVVDEQPCAPVVTILGHVDHGKTSLLDNIRNTNVADGEAGGITQTTSAFRVPVKAGDGERMVTFIDTPGHEAFTEMRARGAKVTDIVVLVIAADDGVMPQTIESIAHAKAAGVPIVVALNKIDKAEATDENIQRILGQLAEHELNPVDWGGDTEVIRTSAIKNEGIQDLLDILDYQAELLDLKADFGGPAEGTVIEAHLADPLQAS